ncbi:cupin domain-containing protein [Erwinia sp.]|uniref:cupin domain-containing protein n=1 Tax=Erwinia citreus TaxID=558 RepID=UPI003C72C539
MPVNPLLSNLFSQLPDQALKGGEETFETLLSEPHLRVERIVSTGQASPPDFWYCQPQGEWVIVLQGSAGLRLEQESEIRILLPGEFVNIPPNCRHRVEWTAADIPTVWLAIHYGELPAQG